MKRITIVIISSFLFMSVTDCTRVCQNGGTLNEGNCTCDCVGDFSGPNCESECINCVEYTCTSMYSSKNR